MLRIDLPNHGAKPQSGMQNDRPIPLPMSEKLVNAWRAVFNRADFIELPDPIKDKAIAKFLRYQRPDFFNMDFAGDCLLWYLGMPRPSKDPAKRAPGSPTGFRMSDQLRAALTELTLGMDPATTADPTWEAILVLREINAAAFDLSNAGDSLAYFLAGLDAHSAAE